MKKFKMSLNYETTIEAINEIEAYTRFCERIGENLEEFINIHTEVIENE